VHGIINKNNTPVIFTLSLISMLAMQQDSKNGVNSFLSSIECW